jgi:hypothetical protein
VLHHWVQYHCRRNTSVNSRWWRPHITTCHTHLTLKDCGLTSHAIPSLRLFTTIRWSKATVTSIVFMQVEWVWKFLKENRNFVLFGIRRKCQNNGRSLYYGLCSKGDITDCGGYWGISLLLITYRILFSILLLSLTSYICRIIGDYQHEFWHNWSTAHLMFCIHQVLESGLGIRPYNTSAVSRLQESLWFSWKRCILQSLNLAN